MNEELQKALFSILSSTINAATAAKDFLISEMPEVIRQLLMWKAIDSGIGFAVGVAWIIAAFFIAKKVRAMLAENELDFPEMALSTGGALCLVLGVSVCAHNLVWLQILVAPKIYLIEYAASLVK